MGVYAYALSLVGMTSMPIQIRLMSWNIQKKQTNAAYIAAIMRAYQIDICALLEVPNMQAIGIPSAIVAELNNLTGPTYFQNAWIHDNVNVGDEAVAYIWHQDGAVGPNAFVAPNYTNNAFSRVKGKVMRDTNGNAIYFPTTKYKWSSLPGTPIGRRPAFMVFATNDGAAQRTFSFLDIHTPFNTSTSIQSYSSHLYATSREITAAESLDTKDAARTGSFNLDTTILPTINPLLTSIANHATFIDPQTVATAAVNTARRAIEDSIDSASADLPTLYREAVNDGINGAVTALSPIPIQISVTDATALARGCAMAGTLAAASMVASIALPTAPPAATASVAAARLVVQNAITNFNSPYSHPAPKTAQRLRDAVRTEAKRMARAAQLTFGLTPRYNLNGSVVAGDFNVHYPDATVYTPAQLVLLNNGNAYTRLLALGAAGATNHALSTRIGPTAFIGQRIYRLRTPCPIQHTTPGAANYVPLNMTPLITTPTDFMGFAAWVAGLRQLAQNQGRVWAQFLNPPYNNLLYNAFDSTTRINDTSFYRANCYDNMFVRGANVVASGLVDVMGELGTWAQFTVPNPRPALAPNPWPAARARLNPIAQNDIGIATVQFTYSGIAYDVDPTLDDAEQTAVFYDQYISDHLPVVVEIQI